MKSSLMLRLAGVLAGCVLLCLPFVMGRKTVDPGGGKTSPLQQGKVDCTYVNPLPPDPSVKPWFREVTREVGIDFEQIVGPLGSYFMPEINGAGGAWFDFDGDGDLDLFLVQSGRSPQGPGEFPAGTFQISHLYRNEGSQFVNVTAGSGLADVGYGVGCAAGDFDNDGDPDLYVTCFGPDKLFENLGGGKFRDISEAAGLNDGEWGTGVACIDFDADGWLDLFVSEYVADPIHGLTIGCGFGEHRVSYCGPLKFSSRPGRLLRNLGRDPADPNSKIQFEDVSKAAKVDRAAGAGFACHVADFNNDQWPDIFVCHDMHLNRLFINRRDGTFQEEALPRGLASNRQGVPQGSMGVAVGDVDGDGKFDLLVTNFTTEGSSLYLQKSGGLFAEETRDRGLFEASKPHTGWGTVFADFDHDGDLDLAVANGLVVPCRLNFAPHGEEEQVATRRPVADVAAYWRDYHDVNQMFANDGTGHFNDVSRQAGDFTLTLGSARALLAGDYDNDGDLDLLVTYCGERARLYQNNAPRRETNWVQIRVTEPALGGRIAYGAEVEITGKGKSWRQTVSPQSSYLANHDPRLHFGLGTVDEIEKVTVRWVGGGVETFPGGPVRRLMTIERGTGQSAVALGPSASGASSAP